MHSFSFSFSHSLAVPIDFFTDSDGDREAAGQDRPVRSGGGAGAHRGVAGEVAVGRGGELLPARRQPVRGMREFVETCLLMHVRGLGHVRGAGAGNERACGCTGSRVRVGSGRGCAGGTGPSVDALQDGRAARAHMDGRVLCGMDMYALPRLCRMDREDAQRQGRAGPGAVRDGQREAQPACSGVGEAYPGHRASQAAVWTGPSQAAVWTGPRRPQCAPHTGTCTPQCALHVSRYGHRASRHARHARTCTASECG